MEAWSRAVVLMAVMLAGSRQGCTVGCRPQPTTAFLAGPEVIPLKRVGPCMFYVEGPMTGTFPSYDGGFYGVVVNGLSETELIEHDPAAGTLTLREPVCSRQRARTMELWHYRWMRTVER